jgi:hypothetical protein
MAEEFVKIINRNDTADNWKSANPILKQGEIGIDNTNKQIKLGDNQTAWNNLQYYQPRVDWQNVQNKPSIPQPNDSKVFIFNGKDEVGVFTLNQTNDVEITIPKPKGNPPLEYNELKNTIQLKFDERLFKINEEGQLTIEVEKLIEIIKSMM